MGKTSQTNGHHGLGARGQGKLLYFHTRTSHAVEQSKDQILRKRRRSQDHCRPDGHWAP